MKSKSIKTIAFILLFISASLAGTNILSYNICGFSSYVTNESREVVQNPYMGFYHIYAYSLTDNDTSDTLSFCERIKTNNPYSLALIEINLKNFSNSNLSETALNQLETILSSCENANKNIILRFLYDWDGKALSTEPDTIEQIFTHMDQIAPYVNSHKDAVYIMQGIFAGDYGEMHGSKYMSEENMTALMNHLDSCIDSSVFLAVRTPQHWRIINNTLSSDLSDKLKNSPALRLSLFNDGIAGSESDLGTYGSDSFANSLSPSDKGTRLEELAFQNELCNYVPNGGECVIDNVFNDFDNVIKDFDTMHISYLNCDYDANVINKWKNSTYTGDGVFNQTNGYDYIQAHLGYRYVVTNSSLSNQNTKKQHASIDITIKNTGFSPAYRQFDSGIILINNSTQKRTFVNAAFDNRKILSSSSETFSIDFDTEKLESGCYNVYYQMYIPSDDSTKQLIKTANEGYDISNGGLFIGTLYVEK